MQSSDIVLRKSETVTDTGTNGGIIGYQVVNSGNKHALFPMISPSDRDVSGGMDRLRKCGLCNINSDDETAYDMRVFFSCPTNGQDTIVLHLGTQSNIQSELTGYEQRYGCGTLNTALSGGETSVELVMETQDVGFAPGGYLFLHDHLMTGQTVDDGSVAGLPKVRAGDSCEDVAGEWRRKAFTTNVTYPYGRYLGDGVVYTVHTGSHQQLIKLKEYKTEDEVIAAVPTDNTATQITLTALTPGNGIEGNDEYQVVVTATCDSVTRTVTVNGDGSCSGYCASGELVLDTGIWTTSIDWLTAPDGDTNITATYYTKNYTKVTNTYTVELDEQVNYAFAVGDTYGAGVLAQSEIKTSFDNVNVNSTSGTFDSVTYPITLFNIGTTEDAISLIFSSATAYSCTSVNYGSLGSGSITADFTPLNSDTGTSMFTIPSDAFGGTYAPGDTVTFSTHPSILPVWMVQNIPEGMAVVEEDDNWILSMMFLG